VKLHRNRRAKVHRNRRSNFAEEAFHPPQLRKISSHQISPLLGFTSQSDTAATREVYSFVHELPFDQEWTDTKLYKRYGLTKDEVAFIESQVAEHVDDSALCHHRWRFAVP